MSSTSALEERLKELERRVPEIVASALVSSDGLMIASALRSEGDEERIAAMCAALVSVAERISRELNKGRFEMGIIKGEKGYIITTNAGPDAVLITLTTSDAKLGLVFLEMKRAAEDLAKMLSGTS